VRGLRLRSHGKRPCTRSACRVGLGAFRAGTSPFHVELWQSRNAFFTSPSLSLCLSLICWSFSTVVLAVHGLVRPMTQPLQVGDRVRLTSKYQGKQFHPGDTGTVVDVVPAASSQGTPVYRVRLDAGHAKVHPTFHQDELERV